MVKRAFLLVLLQVCVCFKLNMNLNNEIVKSLNKLKTNSHPASQNVSVPGHYMNNNPSHCVSTFTRELKNLLRNRTPNITTAKAKHKEHLQSLKVNLDELEGHHVSDDKCTMTQLNTRGRNATWINKYIHFLKKLNSNR